VVNRKEYVKKKLERAEKKWKERVEDGEQEERIEEMDPEDESSKNLQMHEAMIKFLNMTGKTKCKNCKQSRLILKHIEAIHGVKCRDLAIEKDLDELMKIKRKIEGNM